MIKKYLEEVKNIDSVETVFAVSYRGEIADRVGEGFSEEELKSLAVRILAVVATFSLVNKKVTEIEYYWQNRFIIVKTTDRFAMVTVCRSMKILSLLRITLNVTMARLIEDKTFNKWLKNHLGDRAIVLKKFPWSRAEKNILSKLR